MARLNRCGQLEPRANIFDRQTVATYDSFYFNAEVRKRSEEKRLLVLFNLSKNLLQLFFNHLDIFEALVFVEHTQLVFFSLNVKTGKLPQIARAEYESIFTVRPLSLNCDYAWLVYKPVWGNI